MMSMNSSIRAARDTTIQAKTQEIQNEMTFQSHVVLKYKITYPQFYSKQYGRILKNINMYYQLQAKKYTLNCEKKLYKMAVDQYEYSRRNRLPIQTFEAQDTFTLTYNKNLCLSLFMDRYEYLGGAHGSIERRADTWNLNLGGHNELMNFFPRMRSTKEYIIAEITKRVEQEIECGSSEYFDEYEADIRRNFDFKSFYLTSTGLVIFYQPYDIAPYFSGVPEFKFSYGRGGATPPGCCGAGRL